MTKKSFFIFGYLVALFFVVGQSFQYANAQDTVGENTQPIPGAYNMTAYLPMLRNKKVAVLVNQTSEVNGVLLPDTLLKRGVDIVKIFSPEHGFRGNADAGAGVKNGIDKETGLPVISLYGKHKKPSAMDLADVDLVIYDIQDVGVRFYTYISTLQYMMEACGKLNIPMIILDRPDPLGFIVDGPVLQTNFHSFVGMQPVPVVYGMTPGEYARMLIGQKWLQTATPKLKVIRCLHYRHASLYKLPVAPSPNLKDMAAIYLYPSLCLFEGTVISVGRGTDFPFQCYGHPKLKQQPDSFIPKSMPGATHPKLKGQICYGRMLAKNSNEALKLIDGKMRLKWLLRAYKAFPDKEHFFNSFFNKLAGNMRLKINIQKGETVSEIRASWQPALKAFKQIRAQYLLYPDTINVARH